MGFIMFTSHKLFIICCLSFGIIVLFLVHNTPKKNNIKNLIINSVDTNKLNHIINYRQFSNGIDHQSVINIAIGCAITSHGEHFTTDNMAEKLPLLKSLIPSFCTTSSSGFNYHFYVAYDIRDPCFNKREYISSIHKVFQDLVGDFCPAASNVSLYFVRCNHNKNPAWAQNDAMMEAYLDHMDYYYRVNDDTKMLTPGWTEIYIESLKSFDPPNVGVVGPKHRGGNEDILTYDFVHRNHIDIFGTYYPREFTDWWADNWISSVYGESRTLKLPSIRLIHTSEAGTRYQIRPDKDKYLKRQIKDDQLILERYLRAKENINKPLDKSLVISMSLWGSKTRYTFGALRNAQLRPVHFPGWKLRIYVEQPRNDGTTSFPRVEARMLLKLQKLGVEIVRVNHHESLIPPMMWRFLAADDTHLDAFIVRDADCRLSDRDAIAVNDWLNNSASPFHCLRDHPSHSGYAVLGGLWGGRPKLMKKLILNSWHDMMMGLRTDYSQDMTFLNSHIWPVFKGHAFCHDSFTCTKWPNSRPFPVLRLGTEHLGQVYDAFGNVKDDDVMALIDKPVAKECLPPSTKNQP